MKFKHLSRRLSAAVCGLVLIAAGMTAAFAETDDPVVPEELPTEVIYTDPVETIPIETEPVYTEPVVTEPIVTEPVPTEPVETTPAATTQAAETTPVVAETQYIGYVDPNPDVTQFIPPTIPKTVSQKSYTTNVAAGIVSWICVLVGLIVIFAVAVSTKVSGMRSRRRV